MVKKVLSSRVTLECHWVQTEIELEHDTFGLSGTKGRVGAFLFFLRMPTGLNGIMPIPATVPEMALVVMYYDS